MRYVVLAALMLLLVLTGAGDPQEAKKAAKKSPVLRLADSGHTAAVNKVLFMPGGERLISVSSDKTVRVWELPKGEMPKPEPAKGKKGKANMPKPEAPRAETVQLFRLPTLGRWGEVYAADLSPDGDTLAVAGWGGDGKDTVHPPAIFLISLKEERILKLLTGHVGSLRALSFSPDGKRLASGGDDHLVRVWDLATGKAIVLKGHGDKVNDVRFHPRDANVLLSAADQVRLWDVAKQTSKVARSEQRNKDKKGKVHVTVREEDTTFHRVAWSPQGDQCVAVGPRRGWPALFVYDRDLNYRSWLQVDRAYTMFPGAAFTPNGKAVIVSAYDDWRAFVGRLPVDGGKEYPPYGSVNNNWEPLPRGDVAVAGTGKSFKVAVADDFDHRIFVWRAGEEEPLILGGAERLVTAVGWIHPKKNQVASRDPTLLWRSRLLQDDDPKKPVDGYFDRSFGLGNLSLADVGPRPRDWDLWALEGYWLSRDGGWLHVKEGKKDTGVGITVPGDKASLNVFVTLVGDKKAVISGLPEGLWLMDMTDGKVVHSFRQLSGPVRGLATSPIVTLDSGKEKRYFAAVGDDNIIRIYDPTQRDPLLYFTAAGSQWIVWTKEGYYGASAFGERLMGWQISRGPQRFAQFYPASEFRASLHRPDVIARVLRTGSVAAAVAAADKARGAATVVKSIADAAPPRVTLLEPSASLVKVEGNQPVELEVRARADSAGQHPVTTLRLLLDQRPYTGAGAVRMIASPKLGSAEATWKIKLEPGLYHIAVQADTAVSKAQSESTRGIKRLGDATAPAAAPVPRLHVLTVGISQYQDPGLKLSYAHKDANVLGDVLRGNGGRVYPKPIVTKLVDADATASRFFAELEKLRGAMKPHDVAVLSFAGHGERDADGKFYLLPVDANPKRMAGTCISGEKFREVLATIPGRVIVLLDACRSGGLGAAPPSRLADAGSELLRRLVSSECGVIVMCSSTGAESSLEGPEWEHGLFTKVVLDGLRGGADYNKDGTVSIKELDLYVSQSVEKLSRGRQHPVTEVPLTFRPIELARP